MKKLLSIVLCFVLVLSLASFGNVSAATAPTITISNVTARSGDNVSVNVSIADNPGIMAIAFCITYDSDVLDYVGSESGFITDYIIKDHTNEGCLSVVSVSNEDVTSNGTMFTVSFKINDTAALGSYEIGIINANPEKYGDSLHDCLSNSKEQFFAPVVNKGYISVVDVVAGDVNGDTKVNGRDYSLLMQYINGWDVEIVEAASDVNGDTKINGRDYTILMQYINGWDIELK